MHAQFYRELVEAHGFLKMFSYAAYRATKKVANVALWNAIVLTPLELDKTFLTLPYGVVGHLLPAEEMRGHVYDKDNNLSLGNLFESSAKGDFCYALFDGKNLASYSFFSTQPTELVEVSRTLSVGFDPSYVYAYHGYTKPQYRGQRLFAMANAGGLLAFMEKGKKGVVTYTDVFDFASINATRRIGYRRFGRVILAKSGDKYVSRTTPGCKAFGFRVEPTDPGTGKSRLPASSRARRDTLMTWGGSSLPV
jgi:hypothetical protein